MADDEVPGRGPTRLKTMCMKINKGKKLSFVIDVNAGVATRPNAKNFSSYLGVVAREKISILTDYWDHLTEHERNMIWQDILVYNCFYFIQSDVCDTLFNLKFVYELIIPNVKTLRAKVLS